MPSWGLHRLLLPPPPPPTTLHYSLYIMAGLHLEGRPLLISLRSIVEGKHRLSLCQKHRNQKFHSLNSQVDDKGSYVAADAGYATCRKT